jgi:tetratricopeptide (TPR) repeat protein
LPDGELATRYRFAHALFQNVLYNDLVGKRRILLHRQAGAQLLRHYGAQAHRIAAQLAVHFERGRDFARAIEYLIKAGDNATRLFANDEAEGHYSHALRLAERLPEEQQTEKYLVLYQKRGGVNFALSHFEQAADDFTNMMRGTRTLRALDLEWAALNSLALTQFYSHQLEAMATSADEAVRVAGRVGSEALRVETMALVGLKNLCYGELAEARTLLDEIVSVARSISHKPALLSGLTWRGALHFWQSEYGLAEKILAEARELALELRDGFLLLTSLFFTGLSQGNMGRMSAALATLEQAIRMAGRNCDKFWYPRMPNCIGWLYRELQDFPKALSYDRQGLDVGRQHHVLEAEANSLINLGIRLHARGRAREDHRGVPRGYIHLRARCLVSLAL